MIQKFLKEKEVTRFISKHGMYILLLFSIFFIIIYLSHISDRDIIEVSKLEEKLEEINSEFVDTRTKLMDLKNENTIKNNVSLNNLKSLEKPPIKLILDTTNLKK